jgi:hypothetical protein
LARCPVSPLCDHGADPGNIVAAHPREIRTAVEVTLPKEEVRILDATAN